MRVVCAALLSLAVTSGWGSPSAKAEAILPSAIIAAASAQPLVASVSLSSGDSPIELSTRPGQTLDHTLLARDVKALYATGRFADIRVETTNPAGSGFQGDESYPTAHVTFYLTERTRKTLRHIRVAPDRFPVKPRLPAGALLDALDASRIAADYQRSLVQHAFEDARVQPELVAVDPHTADLILHVEASEPTKLESLTLTGDLQFDPREVQRALQALRRKRILPGIPGVWSGWTLKPNYSQASLDSAIMGLRSFYASRGYFDAAVRLEGSHFEDGKARIHVNVNPGPRYQVRQWEAVGESIVAQLQPVTSDFTSRDLCQCLLDLRRQSEKAGVLDFSATLRLRTVNLPAEGPPLVDVIATVEQGPAYTVRKIEFQAQRKFSDRLMRANLLLHESEPMDALLLRKSIDRLNRSRLFEPFDERSVVVQTNEETRTADITIRATERKAGFWLLSGPVGPMSLSGPLQFALGTRLPSWGQGILELASYNASFSLLARFDPLARFTGGTVSSHRVMPIFSISRPYSPGEGWRSGFTVAPQLGWRVMGATYAGTQLHERLSPLLAGDQRFEPVLTVTLDRDHTSTMLLCEPPAPKLRWLRVAAGLALQFGAALPML
jgi:hypothetical protein